MDRRCGADPVMMVRKQKTDARDAPYCSCWWKIAPAYLAADNGTA